MCAYNLKWLIRTTTTSVSLECPMLYMDLKTGSSKIKSCILLFSVHESFDWLVSL